MIFNFIRYLIIHPPLLFIIIMTIIIVFAIAVRNYLNRVSMMSWLKSSIFELCQRIDLHKDGLERRGYLHDHLTQAQDLSWEYIIGITDKRSGGYKNKLNKMEAILDQLEQTLIRYQQFAHDHYPQENEEMNKDQRSLNKGKIGEEETAYHLKFIRDEYEVFNGIYLSGGEESQEFDHIVIGKNGIFHIDSKNYFGTISFTERGTERDHGEIHDDPIAQMHRHEYVLRNFLKSHGFTDLDVLGIICFTHPDSRVEGNSPHFRTVKVGALTSTIKSYMPKQHLTQEQIQRINELLKQKGKKSKTYDDAS
ncbi:Nuclease-related domain-containing protein [Paenibacillus sp. yr247]|uniref:nuclease-related domain-containing protein n=1 Tax=Paenibacillus sp. yr247 TaxID=1761880 RepID=UPI000890117F|nr:nuclease-related domain-containing protein [Paenibacillus sp. yr247]SDO14932.1 Nuclease-related domain-containing protein [Paenibacillus sp. yr247]